MIDLSKLTPELQGHTHFPREVKSMYDLYEPSKYTFTISIFD